MATMEIPDDYFVHECNLDVDEPYCVICPEDSYGFRNEIKVLIPKQLAYYLRTHWCGSQKMHDLIEEGVRRNIAYSILDALGIKEVKLK